MDSRFACMLYMLGGSIGTFSILAIAYENIISSWSSTKITSRSPIPTQTPTFQYTNQPTPHLPFWRQQKKCPWNNAVIIGLPLPAELSPQRRIQGCVSSALALTNQLDTSHGPATKQTFLEQNEEMRNNKCVINKGLSGKGGGGWVEQRKYRMKQKQHRTWCSPPPVNITKGYMGEPKMRCKSIEKLNRNLFRIKRKSINIALGASDCPECRTNQRMPLQNDWNIGEKK